MTSENLGLIMTPARDPKQSVFETNPKDHGREINDEEKSRKNRRKRNHREGIIEERGIWEAFGKHLGGSWEAPGRHLGGIQEASGRHPGGHGKYPKWFPGVSRQKTPNVL